MFANDGKGKFNEIWIGTLTSPATTSYFQNWGDYNNDGFLDLLALGLDRGNLLFLNNAPQAGNQNRWLKVQMKGIASNPSGYGALIRVKATIRGETVWQMRQLGIWGGSYPFDYVAHFGLGDATNVDLVRIEWPSGNVQELADVAPDQLRTLTESTLILPVRPSASLNGSVTLTRSLVAGASYQWRFDGVDLVGQTNQKLVLTNLVAGQAGRYSVVVDSGGTVVTNFTYVYVDTQFTKITEGPPVTDRGDSFESGSWGDYDGDGFADLFVARYNVGRSALYRNNRDGTFTSITNVPFAQRGDAASGAWGDLDNDGRLDLFQARLNVPSLIHFNNGDGTFSSFQTKSSLPIFNIATADYDRDGLLDVFLPSYPEGVSHLLRNKGDRTFTQLSSSDVGSIVSHSTVGGGAWADYDDDGWLEVYAANYIGGPNLVFHNDGTGRFFAVTNLVTQTRDNALAGGWGDYDNDGRLDLCVAGGSGTSLYHNLGAGQFERTTLGDTPGRCGSASWADYDNDGFLDIFLTGSGIRNLMFHNNGDGTFTKVTIGSLVTDIPIDNAGSYSGLWFDYDNDGFLDLYVLNGNDSATANTANFLYHNNGNANAWLTVRPIGTTSNRDGVGAKVRALATYAGRFRWQRRDISGGDGISGNQLYAHFGLGNATQVTTLRIEWPSGTVQELTNVAVNQFLTITEPRRPVLSGGVRTTDGAFVLAVTADSGQRVKIYASEDLANWVEVGEWTGSGQAFELPPLSTARFFKAIVVE